uniref:Telomerase reverse transcriptase n=1 Tax=Geotrypetes seraphini TaxID=260995 RepID=A0A6P8PP08_GEOSA|nr:telomerase reverse transcriptase [Geotrypetes seraphini]
MGVLDGEFGEVRRLLSTLYSRTMGLADFLLSLGDCVPSRPLLQSSDSPAYQRFLSELVVCMPVSAKQLSQPINFQQVSSQQELVARVIQKICEKGKRNVLAFGYTLQNEKNSVRVRFASNICNYSPNSTTATISTSNLWEMLLSRIGDDVMMYLLEHCSLFMLVLPSCCYQISGEPIYNFSNERFVPTWFKQQLLPHRCNVLLEYAKKKVHFHKRYLLKGNLWKHKERLQTNITYISSQSRCKVPGSVCSSSQKEAQTATNQQTRARNSDLIVTRHTEDEIERDSQMATWVRSRKRHYDSVSSDVSIKRRKRSLRESEELNHSLSAANGMQIPKIALPRVSLEKNYTTNTTELESVTKGNKGQEIWGEHQLQETGSIIESAQLLEEANPVHGGGGGDAVKTKQTEDISLQYKLFGVKSASSDSNLWSKRSTTPIYIERGFMLYCGRSLKEDFSKSFLLNDLKCSCVGSQRLIETIFLNCCVFGQKFEKTQLGSYRKKKKLPKRYWQMKHVFQEMIHNHKKCPYRAILRKHCPAGVSETNINKNDMQTQVVYEEKGEFKQENNSNEPLVDEMHIQDERRASGHLVGDYSYSVASPVGGVFDQRGKEKQINFSKDLDKVDLLMFLKQHNSIQQVFAFVRECLHKVVPDELWGSSYNKCRFLKNVKKLISMGKYDRFSLLELMWKMRAEDCLWLRLVKGSHSVPASEHRLREEIHAKFLYWLMNTYIIQLLRSFFYITETMFQKNTLSFYRKLVWSKIQKIGFRKHYAKVKLRLMSTKEVDLMQRNKCVPLTSMLRFIPKQDGLRAVVKMSASTGTKTYSKGSQHKKIQHFNTRLKNLFSVLNYKRMNCSDLLGSSVFGLDDIYKLWKQFVLKVKERTDEQSCFYFVKTDVTGAYDTIPLEKLEDVLSNIIDPKEEERYCIRRYATIWRHSNGHIRKSFKTHASAMCDFLPNMKQFVSYLQKSCGIQNTIIVEQTLSLNEISSSLFVFFQQIIHNNILKIHNQYYVQSCGIPQGSILSTLLCSFCYGDMENKLLHAVQQDGILLRLIDDFLLVTPHLIQAKTFLRTLAKGIPQYGCSISPQKTMMNFLIDEDLPGFVKAKQTPGCTLFPWCGLLLDTKTLEIYCDYSR